MGEQAEQHHPLLNYSLIDIKKFCQSIIDEIQEIARHRPVAKLFLRTERLCIATL